MSLTELYGKDFQNEFVESNRKYVADLVVSNISGSNFDEVKHDFSPLFEDNKISKKWSKYIEEKSHELNKSFIVKEFDDIKSIPIKLPENTISYFKVFDLRKKKIYLLYITPCVLDAF
jgi:hypothetical protein